MNALEAMKNRRSYRGAYRPDPVPRAHLEAIMQAGLDAPSEKTSLCTACMV